LGPGLALRLAWTLAGGLGFLGICAGIAAADDKAKAATARGVLKGWHDVRIAADIVARVRTLPFRAGDRFRRGQVLVEFDCDRYKAELRAAEAVQSEQEAHFRNTSTLRRHQAAGALELEVARARLERAQSEADAIRERMRACRIEAPFDGRIAERLIDEHEMPQANAPLLRIVAEAQIEITIIVPSSWLRWIAPGQTLSFAVDELATTHEARVLRVGAAVDPVSQTIEVFAVFVSQPASLKPGMSGVATFSLQEGRG
jgi:RND family efflux transporter MFP subunit